MRQAFSLAIFTSTFKLAEGQRFPRLYPDLPEHHFTVSGQDIFDHIVITHGHAADSKQHVSILSLATHPINELPQLNGQAVGVVVGSSAEAAVPGFSQGVGLSSRGYPTFEAALAGLQTGEVVALLTERWPALDVHFRQPDYVLTDRRYTYRPVALVVSEGDSDFHDLVNLSLMWLQSQGIYQEVYSLWFDDAVPELESWPGLAISLVIQR